MPGAGSAGASMTSVRVNELISVAGQPDAAGFAAFAADGFAAVINARPDGEEPGQPGNTAEKLPPLPLGSPTASCR